MMRSMPSKVSEVFSSSGEMVSQDTTIGLKNPGCTEIDNKLLLKPLPESDTAHTPQTVPCAAPSSDNTVQETMPAIRPPSDSAEADSVPATELTASNGQRISNTAEKSDPDEKVDSGAGTQATPANEPSSEDTSNGDDLKIELLEDHLVSDIRNRDSVRDFEAASTASSLEKSTHYMSRQALSYFVLVEARIKELESEVSQLKQRDAQQAGTSTPTPTDLETPEADEKPTKSTWNLKPGWKSLNEFYKRDSKNDNIIDVLLEEMRHRPLRVKQQSPKPRFKAAHSTIGTEPGEGVEKKRVIHRIRIISPLINDAFAAVMGTERPPVENDIHIRPFKAILAYHDDIKAHLADMQSQLSEDTRTAGDTLNIDASSAHLPANVDGRSVSDVLPQDEYKKGVEAVEHVRAYVDFVEEHLQPDLASHRRYRSRITSDTSARIAFNDLWKMFAPGDIIYSPNDRQASHVIYVAGGRPALRWRDSDGDIDDVRITERTISDFVITCFYLDFDGTEIGPVQHEISIPYYEGSRTIIRLPTFPIEYFSLYDADQSVTPSSVMTETGWRKHLQMRGKKFSDLAVKDQIAHKEYEGLSLGTVQEQIDSEVIIDLDKFYQLQKRLKPILGFGDIEEVRWRETCETWMDEDSVEREDFDLYDDHHVDQDLKEKAMKRIPEVVKWRSGGQDHELRAKHLLLFPRWIHGFVLQTRKWRELDVDNIDDLTQHGQSFGDLVLPDDHKEIVKSLVDSHAMGPKSVAAVASIQPAARRVQEDLVRGKGKGLIILLHGVPGVGKTSTAECVAQYTGRPLYAMTCGDLGETPEKVQEKLQESFNLAYRWSCVMLLDEADVLLAARDRTDLTRNAVVSVLLRTLEYYSGILFLTTNRVGVLDEAFKSRIHVSLFYKALSKKQTKKIWKINLDRLQKIKPELIVHTAEIMKWVDESWIRMKQTDNKKWNGRQIHNAVRTAAALAAFKEGQKNELTVATLQSVEKASKEFDKYLEDTTGHDDDARAAADQIRRDPRVEGFWSERLAQGRSSFSVPRSNRSTPSKRQPQGGKQQRSRAAPIDSRRTAYYGGNDDHHDEDDDDDDDDDDEFDDRDTRAGAESPDED